MKSSGKKSKIVGILVFLLLALVFSRVDKNPGKISSEKAEPNKTNDRVSMEPIKIQLETVIPTSGSNTTATTAIQSTPTVIVETRGDAVEHMPQTEKEIRMKEVDQQFTALTFYDASGLNGRGIIDIWGTEPNYVNAIGFAAVYIDSALEVNVNFHTTPWSVPIFDRTEEGWKEIGTIEHKTKIGIVSQELWKQNGKEYQGYLGFQDLESGKCGYINVKNFVTTPYWEKNVSNAVDKGYGIAVFQQISKYVPVYKDGKQADIQNNTKVLLPIKGSYYVSIMDKINYQITGIAFIKKNSKVEPYYVFFNKKDLTLVY